MLVLSILPSKISIPDFFFNVLKNGQKQYNKRKLEHVI